MIHKYMNKNIVVNDAIYSCIVHYNIECNQESAFLISSLGFRKWTAYLINLSINRKQIIKKT